VRKGGRGWGVERMEKTALRSFRDPREWQAAMDLVERVYLLTHTFPQHQRSGLASQLQRAAISIPSNIAEGHTRAYSQEYLHHVSLARASLAELQTQLAISARLPSCPPEQIAQLLEQADSLGRQLSALRNVPTKGANPQPPIPNPE
jgi:four helix bundle protein